VPPERRAAVVRLLASLRGVADKLPVPDSREFVLWAETTHRSSDLKLPHRVYAHSRLCAADHYDTTFAFALATPN